MCFSLQVQGFTDSIIAVQLFWAGLALGQKIHKMIHCKIRTELIQPQACIGKCLWGYYSNLFVKIKIKKNPKNHKPLPTSATCLLLASSSADVNFQYEFTQQLLQYKNKFVLFFLPIKAQPDSSVKRNSASRMGRQLLMSMLIFSESCLNVFSFFFFFTFLLVIL